MIKFSYHIRIKANITAYIIQYKCKIYKLNIKKEKLLIFLKI